VPTSLHCDQILATNFLVLVAWITDIFRLFLSTIKIKQHVFFPTVQVWYLGGPVVEVVYEVC